MLNILETLKLRKCNKFSVRKFALTLLPLPGRTMKVTSFDLGHFPRRASFSFGNIFFLYFLFLMYTFSEQKFEITISEYEKVF